jgi:hypothetical protein
VRPPIWLPERSLPSRLPSRPRSVIPFRVGGAAFRTARCPFVRTLGPFWSDLRRCHFPQFAASVDGGEEAMTMGFIIVTAVIVGAALFMWWFIFSPRAIDGSVRRPRRR